MTILFTAAGPASTELRPADDEVRTGIKERGSTPRGKVISGKATYSIASAPTRQKSGQGTTPISNLNTSSTPSNSRQTATLSRKLEALNPRLMGSECDPGIRDTFRGSTAKEGNPSLQVFRAGEQHNLSRDRQAAEEGCGDRGGIRRGFCEQYICCPKERRQMEINPQLEGHG